MKYKLWLATIPSTIINSPYKLLMYGGSAKDIFYMSEGELKLIYQWPGDRLTQFLSHREAYDPDKELEIFNKTGMKLITIEDEGYPYRLRMIHSPPYGLFYFGSLDILRTRTIAIIGARHCSEYGKTAAFNIAKGLVLGNNTIISGMACGIDTQAHLGALYEDGKTAAVLGCGADIIYPRSNRSLYNKIRTVGLILSEYSPGTQPLAYNFPVRNRIISGLSDIVIVIEAKEKSGSLITCDFALEQGKDIYVLPGRVGEPLSYGCNKLISQGAGIIYDIDKFTSDLKITSKKRKGRKVTMPEINDSENAMLNLLGIQPMELETIIGLSPYTPIETIEHIVSLQKKNCIKEIFKNMYIRSNIDL